MTRAGNAQVQLDRAHVEGQVIASNLEHLGTVLSGADRGLRDELKLFTRKFGLYVGRLSDASAAASNVERSRQAREDGSANAMER